MDRGRTASSVRCELVERLTPLDATFLELEQADQGAHMHIGGVMIFEPRPGGAPRIDQVRKILRERLCELPRYGQRLSAPATGGLSWPNWEEDPDFDIARHVRRERIPEPGGDAELLDWAGEFYSERLDRSRPLWEMVLLSGIAGDRWAIATKTHHCMIDGVGSVDMATLMLDTEPDPPRRRAPRPLAAGSNGGVEEDESGAGSLLAGLARVPLRVAGAAARLAAGGAHTATHPAEARQALTKARATVELLIRDEVVAAPRTSLNVPISGQRRLAVTRVPLSELKVIKRQLGGTINDVVLAAAAGGLRELLLERGEAPPAAGLRAMVPVNIRAAGDHLALGNKITSLFVHLPVAAADPLERYRRQVEEAESLKSGTQAVGSKTLVDLASLAPPALHSLIAQSLFATRLFNVTVTNVPGPQQPLYSFGSRMVEVWPIVPLAAEHCIGLAVFSYDGDLFFTLNADRHTVPDLDVLATGIETAIAQLRALCPAPR